MTGKLKQLFVVKAPNLHLGAYSYSTKVLNYTHYTTLKIYCSLLFSPTQIESYLNAIQ